MITHFIYLFIYLFIYSFIYFYFYFYFYIFTYLFISYAKQMMKMLSNCVPVQPGLCSSCRKPYGRFYVTNNYLFKYLYAERETTSIVSFLAVDES